MNDKLLSALGLARRAGQLIYGFETVKCAVRSGKAKLVVTATDLSEKTAENVSWICQQCGVELVPVRYSMVELSAAVGKPAGVAAITDDNFVRLVKSNF